MNQNAWAPAGARLRSSPALWVAAQAREHLPGASPGTTPRQPGSGLPVVHRLPDFRDSVD